jgi:hypothetical protein
MIKKIAQLLLNLALITFAASSSFAVIPEKNEISVLA